MSRKLVAGSAVAAALLSLNTPALSATDDFKRGKPETGVQSRPVPPAQPLSGPDDVRQRRGGGAPGELPGNAAPRNPETRFSTKSSEAERLTDNPEKRRADSAVPQERAESGRPDPGTPARAETPGPSIQDRSSEVR
jgi:hypothetical protein